MNKVYYVNSLKHYASEYYDPVKAHEYYEKTKQLKGKHAGRKLNDAGKEAKAYVTDQINQKMKSTREQAKKDVSSFSEQTSAEINKLRDEILSIPKSEMKSKGAQIQAKIDLLKSRNQSKREEILSKMSGDVEGLKKTKESEIDKIYNDAATSEAVKEKGSAGSVTPTKHMSKEDVEKIHKMAERMKKDKS